MRAFADWLSTLPLSVAIQNLLWIVPAVQTVHLVAVAAVLSSMLMIGLRLLGRAGRFQTVEQTLQRYLPWVWTGLAVLALTGAVLIVGEPVRTLLNPSFWIKMALLVAAVTGALLLRRMGRSISAGRRGDAASHHRGGAAAHAAVALEMALWCSVAVAGRWIAYSVPA